MESPEMEPEIIMSPEKNIHAYHRNCRRYLYELRSGLGDPFKTYNKVIDTRLHIICYNPELVLPRRLHTAIALDPVKARYLINGYRCGSVAVTDLEGDPTPKLLFRKPTETRKPIVEVDWLKKASAGFMASATDGLITLWDIESARPIDSYEVGDSHILRRMRMHWGINSLVAVATSSRTVEVFNPSTFEISHQIQWNKKRVDVVQWHPRDKNFIFVGTARGESAMFDIRHTGRPFRTLPTSFSKPITKAQFTRDGSKLVLMDKMFNISVFRMDDGTAVENVTYGFNWTAPNLFFDLIEEGSELRVIVPHYPRALVILPLILPPNVSQFAKVINPATHLNVGDYTVEGCAKRREFPMIETGFVGNVIAAQYRRGQQHIVAIATDQQCNILTPSVDMKPESVPSTPEE